MLLCLIVQPIHQVAAEMLLAGGLEVIQAKGRQAEPGRADLARAAAIITRNAGFSADDMDAAPDLRVIGVHGTGTDPIDVRHATRLGIPVVSTPGINAQSVAEQALALLLAVAKQTLAADRAVRCGDFAFKYRAPLLELAGKTLGVVGWGQTGKCFAALAKRALLMDVLVHSPSARLDDLSQHGFRFAATLEDLLAASDVVSLHLPLKPATRNLLNAKRIAGMKSGAILINTARGAVVDEEALVAALRKGHLRGAGLDVFASETMVADHPLLRLENVVLSPHVGGSTEEALERTARAVAQGVLDVLGARRPGFLVNPEVWNSRRNVPQPEEENS